MVSESLGISRTWAMRASSLSFFLAGAASGGPLFWRGPGGGAANVPATRGWSRGLLEVKDLLDQLDRLLGVGTDAVFHLAVIGGRHVEAGEPLDGVVEVVEAGALDAVGDLGAHPVEGPALLEDHAAGGLPHRLHDQILDERAQGAGVEALRLDPVAGEHLRRGHRALDHLRPPDDGA